MQGLMDPVAAMRQFAPRTLVYQPLIPDLIPCLRESRSILRQRHHGHVRFQCLLEDYGNTVRIQLARYL